MKKMRLVIIDDHKLIRQTWSFILNSDSRFEVVGEAGNAEEGLEICRELRPDMVMLDINLTGMNGIEVLPLLRKFVPAAKIIGVTMHTQPVYAKKMMQNGALGYVTKNSSRQEMVHALLEVQRGEKYVCNAIKDALSEAIIMDQADNAGINILSMREMEVIELIKKGLSSKEIASETSISVKTVEVHRYNILKKLKLRNAAELVNFVHQHNYMLN